MKYKHILFDADDTLLDFQAAEREALNQLFKSLNLPPTDALLEQYHKINHSLWAAFERGEITKDDILSTRFRTLLAEVGLHVDRPNLEVEYQDLLASGHMIIPGVFQILDQLKEHFDLYIVTNGVASTQYSRLNASGLSPYFKDIFISEDTGFQKPQIEFFQYVFDRIPNFDPEKAIIIGDSLSSDMQGGINASIDTCWYNPNRVVNSKRIVVTYEIQTLHQLLDILIQ